MTTAIIVQARMNGTRLPGKVLLPIMGRPMLSYQMERLRRVRDVHRIVLATTINRADDVIAELGAREKILVVRGSEDDVLDRFDFAASTVEADTIIRVTADCPLIDPAVMDRCLTDYWTSSCDYLVPVGEPDGNTMEVFSRKFLTVLNREVKNPEDRQHVTLAAVRDPERWAWRMAGSPARYDLQYTRWTVDTAADFALIQFVFESLYPENPRFNTADVADLMERHPDRASLNSAVVQDHRAEDSGLWRRLRASNPWLAR